MKHMTSDMSTLNPSIYVQSWLVPPRVKSRRGGVANQVWDSAQDGVGDQIHIDYDGEYGSAAHASRAQPQPNPVHSAERFTPVSWVMPCPASLWRAKAE